MPAEEPTPVTARALSKCFGKVRALDGVSIEVPRHAVYALIGSNGTGKSTLMRLLLNIHRATSGESSVLGICSADLRPHHFQRIGYVAEGQRSPDWLTARQYGDFLAPFYPQWNDERYTGLCGRLGVSMTQPLERMSRGTRMKALLSGALAFRPECLLLDEPLGGLDPLAREEIVEVLRESAAGTTTLITSHDLFEVELIATHIGYLDEGRIAFSEPIGELRARFEGLSLREIFLKLARASRRQAPA